MSSEIGWRRRRHRISRRRHGLRRRSPRIQRQGRARARDSPSCARPSPSCDRAVPATGYPGSSSPGAIGVSPSGSTTRWRCSAGTSIGARLRARRGAVRAKLRSAVSRRSTAASQERGVDSRPVRRWRACPRERPRGIWTIDNSESSPLSKVRRGDRDHRQAPGRVVFAATMPGRCAAPPAAAMNAPRCPRGFSGRRVLEHPIRACDAPGTTLGLERHGELGEQIDRGLHHGTVESGLAPL